jgi:hypothetical protein
MEIGIPMTWHPISNHEFDNEVLGWSAQMQRAA